MRAQARTYFFDFFIYLCYNIYKSGGGDFIVINYKGRSIEVLNYDDITEEERATLQAEFFAKPPFSQVLHQLKNLSKNGVMVDKITKYYFRDIMAKTQLKDAKWTVEEVFESKELLGIFKARTKTNPRVFDSPNLSTNIATAIRLGGHNIAGFPPNFPMKTAKEIVKKYNINNNWYDFSCGWGVRLLCALTQGINYYGTDPNYLLVERLQELHNDYKNNIGMTSIVDIRTQGSEIFIPEWENTIGLAFSSPPYFDLEDYAIGNQSYTKNTTYTDWQQNYLTPTLTNIYKYLINDGVLALNIKNNRTYKLADDAKKLAEQCGFQLLDIEPLTNNQRNTPSGLINNSEEIFIFKKIPKNNNQTLSSMADSFPFSFTSVTNDNLKNTSSPQIDNTTIVTSDQNKVDVYLIGVKSKKQLSDINIYNSENFFLGERYFSTFFIDILSTIKFLTNYTLGKYIEVTKQNVIELLSYASFHRDCNNNFKTVNKLCEIIDTWDDMEANNFHLFLQIENN